MGSSPPMESTVNSSTPQQLDELNKQGKAKTEDLDLEETPPDLSKEGFRAAVESSRGAAFPRSIESNNRRIKIYINTHERS